VLNHRRMHLHAVLFALGVAVHGCDGGDSTRATTVLLTVEELDGSALGSGGSASARTPHLDRLARSGTYVARTWSPSTSIEATLASLLTGLTPADHGVSGDGFALATPTIVERFAKRGLATGSFAGSSAADTRSGLIDGFRHSVIAFDGPDAPRVGEPWNERAKLPVDSVVGPWIEWYARTKRASFSWIHASETATAGTTIASIDRAVGAITRAVRSRPGGVVVVAGAGALAPIVAARLDTYAPAVHLEDVPCTEVATLLEQGVTWAPLHVSPAPAAPPAVAIEPAELAQARELDRRGDMDGASEAYARVLEVEPNRVDVRFRRAELAFQSDHADSAREIAESILVQVPHHAEVRLLLARACISTDLNRSRSLLDPVMAWYPTHAGARLVAAEIAIASGDHSSALRDLRAAFAGAGRRTELRIAIAAAFSRVGFHGDAVDLARAVIRSGDRRPQARYTLAYALEKAERFPECVVEYRALLDDHPDFLPAYRNLGSLMARDGEVERAILLWENALRFHPDDEGIKANLEEARRALGLRLVEG